MLLLFTMKAKHYVIEVRVLNIKWVNRRTKSYTDDEWKKIRGEDDIIISTFSLLIGSDFLDAKVGETVLKRQNHISRYYYECSDEILLSLGQLFLW